MRSMSDADSMPPSKPTLTHILLTKIFWKDAKVILPRRKEVVTIRLDADLLDWLRQQPGYQTRINAILRSYMKGHENERNHH